MNDRFKFRAWCDLGDGYYLNNPMENLYLSAILGDLYVWEQCTGLKDKNGTLIYEGDILKYKLTKKNACASSGKVWNSVTGGIDWEWSVIWKEGGWSMLANPHTDRIGTYKRVKNRSRLGYKEVPITKKVEVIDKTLSIGNRGSERIEVIGNIHENPELINGS